MELTDVTGLTLTKLKEEMTSELEAIISWWVINMPDKINGGFYGNIDNNNIPDTNAPKGIVLNSRILWTFSAASTFSKNNHCKEIASRAYQYICNHFLDNEFGGVYWSVDGMGKPHEDKKQIYGIAFFLYGLSEYYEKWRDENVLQLAIRCFRWIESYSFDKKNGGYFEAFTRDWQKISDLRLSAKDINESKTMNTHLHILEAYTNLYKIWNDELLKDRIIHLLELFDKYFIDKNSFHLHLFFDDQWELRSSLQSYGHDIEAAWLLRQCALVIGNKKLIQQFGEYAVRIADAAAEGLDIDGGLWYEYEKSDDHLIKEKHWWPQAEALIGFLDVYHLTKNKLYLHKAFNSWRFIEKHLRDNLNGEWYWGITEDYNIIGKEKAGFWKCPYHNSRACIEVITRNFN